MLVRGTQNGVVTKKKKGTATITFQVRLTITAVKFSDGTKYKIPESKQQTWYYTR